MEHIQAHQYYLKENENRDVGICDAASSWYDLVYLPVAKILVTRAVSLMLRQGHRDRTWADAGRGLSLIMNTGTKLSTDRPKVTPRVAA